MDANLNTETTKTFDVGAEYVEDSPQLSEQITFEQLKTLVGTEEATNRRVLKQQFHEDFIAEASDA